MQLLAYFGHVREAGAEALIVGANEGVRAHHVDEVGNEHQGARRKLPVDAAAGVGQHHLFHAQQLEHIERVADFLHGVALIEMEAAFHGVDFRVPQLAKQTADELGIAYKEGVYMGFMGPCYETAAEIRAFAGMGADAVGMSTVPETMVCNYMGMKVLAVSCITNMATGIQTVKHSHARVLEIANQAGDTLCRWLGAVIQRME